MRVRVYLCVWVCRKSNCFEEGGPLCSSALYITEMCSVVDRSEELVEVQRSIVLCVHKHGKY